MDLAKLSAVGLDKDEGLAYCADDPEFYAEMLGEYVSESAGTAAALRQYFSERDWDAYAVRIHALKTASRIIGAASAAETAYELEMAAKHRDAERMNELHSGFIEEYLELTEQICEALI